MFTLTVPAKLIGMGGGERERERGEKKKKKKKKKKRHAHVPPLGERRRVSFFFLEPKQKKKKKKRSTKTYKSGERKWRGVYFAHPPRGKKYTSGFPEKLHERVFQRNHKLPSPFILSEKNCIKKSKPTHRGRRREVQKKKEK